MAQFALLLNLDLHVDDFRIYSLRLAGRLPTRAYLFDLLKFLDVVQFFLDDFLSLLSDLRWVLVDFTSCDALLMNTLQFFASLILSDRFQAQV